MRDISASEAEILSQVVNREEESTLPDEAFLGGGLTRSLKRREEWGGREGVE